jgi:hypothetical protein
MGSALAGEARAAVATMRQALAVVFKKIRMGIGSPDGLLWPAGALRFKRA